jgi:methionyl-tRNA formyltransferase
MRIVFFGSSGFSVPLLRSIAQDTVCVVTKRAKPKGRGYSLDDNEVKREAEVSGLPLVEIDSFKDDVVKTLPDYSPDLFVVASFGLIVPQWVLDMPLVGPLNVHPSLLPLYRGPSPIQWALLSGDEITGITFIKMNEKMDEGDVVYQEQVAIGEKENYIELSERLSEKAASMLPGVLSAIEMQGVMEGARQSREKATYAPIITKEMGLIKWTKSAVVIDRQVRAFIQWPTAYTFLDGRMLKVFKATVTESQDSVMSNPGQIKEITREGLVVDTGQGLLTIEELQIENKKRMKAYDFAQGSRGLAGKILTDKVDA